MFLIQRNPKYHPEFNSHLLAKFFLQFKFKIQNPTGEDIEKFINDYINDEFNKNVNVIEYRKLCYNFMKN